MDLEMWKMMRLDQGPGFLPGSVHLTGLTRPTEIMTGLHAVSLNPAIFKAESQPLLNLLSIRYVLSNKAPVRYCDPLPLGLPFWKSSYKEGDKYVSARPPRAGRSYRMAPGSVWTISVALMPGDALAMTVWPREAAPHLRVRVGAPDRGETVSWERSETTVKGTERGRMALPVARPGDQYLAIIVPEELGRPVEVIAPEVTNPKRPFRVLWKRDYQLYENRQYLDHYGIYTAVITADDRAAKEILFDPDQFDPSLHLILAPEAVDSRIPEQGARPRKHDDVKVMEYTSNRVVLETEISSPAYLSIAESYYPGWRAWVDGVEARIIRANYAYQAVPLPEPGPHRIVLKFLPTEFKIGLWISVITAMVALVMAVGSGVKSNLRDQWSGKRV
jgi:hypothetical protein